MGIIGIVGLKAGADGNAIAPLSANEARGVWTRLRSGFIRSIKHRADNIPGVVLTMGAMGTAILGMVLVATSFISLVQCFRGDR